MPLPMIQKFYNNIIDYNIINVQPKKQNNMVYEKEKNK